MSVIDPTPSQRAAGAFLQACLDDPAMLARYEDLPLPDLLLQARCAGHGFGAADLAGLIGDIEVWRIVTVAGQPIDASSSLWPRMWGRTRLNYVVRELWASLDDATRGRFGTAPTQGVAS